MRYYKQWKLVHKKTGAIKIEGSFRNCSMKWEELNSDDYKIELVLPVQNARPVACDLHLEKKG